MDDLTQSQPRTTWFKAVLFLGMLLFAFYASTHMVAAGDTWVALACGRHFSNHGVDTVEPFSFNSHPAGPSDEQLAKYPNWTHGLIRKWHPTGWLNQNWLTHLGFYKLVTWFGSDGQYNYNTLVYWKFAIYFITVFAVYGIGKTLGAGDTLSAAAACLAMLVGRSFYDIRPAGYSNMLVPLFILLLAWTMRKNYRLIWLMIPLIVFWANVHGGYIYAFIMFVPFIGINLLCRLPKRWSLSLGLSGLWLVMYLMSHKFITHEYYAIGLKALGKTPETVSLLANSLFVGSLIMIVGSAVLAAFKKIPAGLFYSYHFVISIVWFLILLMRFLPKHPYNLNPLFDSIFSYYVSSSLTSFLFVFAAGLWLISAMTFKKEAFNYLPTKGLCHVIGAAAAALLAMILLNPFHLTNITHTFEISLSKHAESWRQVNEWKPAFDWMDKTTDRANPVGEEEWFGVLCALTGIGIAFWLTGYFLKPKHNRQIAAKRQTQSDAGPPCESAWPKIDLAVIMVALLTIYMAIRSRRFIALAGSAAAPILAMLIYQSWQMISARIRWKQTGLLKGWTLPDGPQYAVKGVITASLVVLAVIWAGKYKRIYLDPWPNNFEYNSVFMRMTASHLKPTDTCQFLRDNNISGKVFNYWTEGGAVAFGQTPDPETGFIPLKLFMDGRAQAAYDHDKFKLWQQVFSGGPTAQKALQKNGKLSPKELEKMGRWVSKQLDDDVWVVLMPQSQDDQRRFSDALNRTGHWKTAYLDDYQRMQVNIETPKGKALINDILQGKVTFPNVHAKDMTLFAVITENRVSARYRELYDLGVEALQEFPTPSSMLMLTRLEAFPSFSEKIVQKLKEYVDDFSTHREQYQKEDGYYQRLGSVQIAANSLRQKLKGEEKTKYARIFKDVSIQTETLRDDFIW